jgi:hypothetical protein
LPWAFNDTAFILRVGTIDMSRDEKAQKRSVTDLFEPGSRAKPNQPLEIDRPLTARKKSRALLHQTGVEIEAAHSKAAGALSSKMVLETCNTLT